MPQLSRDSEKDENKKPASSKVLEVIQRSRRLTREIMESKDPEEIKNSKVYYKNGIPIVVSDNKIPLPVVKEEKLNDFDKSLEIENQIKITIDYIFERTDLTTLDFKLVSINEMRLIKIINRHNAIDVTDLLINNLYLYVFRKLVDLNIKISDWIYKEDQSVFHFLEFDDKTGYGLLKWLDSKKLNQYINKYKDWYIPKIELEAFNLIPLLVNRVNNVVEKKKDKKINFLLFILNNSRSLYDLFNDDETVIINNYIDNEITKPIAEERIKFRNLFWKYKPKQKEKRSKK